MSAMRFPPGLEPVDDLAPAMWVREALKDWPRGRRFIVSDLVPPVFEAYARILHRPIHHVDGRWGTWAEASPGGDLPLDPESPWTGSRSSGGGGWSLGEGSLSVPEVTMLTPVLRAHTGDPSVCWFALWSGFGFLDPGSSYLLAGGSLSQRLATRVVRAKEWMATKRARMAQGRFSTFDLLGPSGRSYLLFLAALGDAERFTSSGHSPTLWWPGDRSWLVHTEIDATSTYLGGSRELIDRLVEQQLLESFEVEADSAAVL